MKGFYRKGLLTMLAALIGFSALANYTASSPQARYEEGQEAGQISATVSQLEQSLPALTEGMNAKQKKRTEAQVAKITEALEKVEAMQAAAPAESIQSKTAAAVQQKLAKKVEKAEKMQANQGMLRTGLILSIVGLVVMLLVSYTVGAIVLAVGLILLLVSLV